MRCWRIGACLVAAMTIVAGSAAPGATATAKLHHVGATLHGPDGAVVRVDARVPKGYRLVLHDPARLQIGRQFVFEIVRGHGQYGVLTVGLMPASTYTTRRDPAYPAAHRTAGAVARSYAVPTTDRLLRETPHSYVLLRNLRPVGVFVGMRGPLPLVLEGIGAGRTLLVAVARTMVARWVSPVPLGPASDPEALALRDRANAAIAAQDSYTESRDIPNLLDVSRSARYLARFADATRTYREELQLAGTDYFHRSPGGCWTSSAVVDTGQFLAPRLPIAAPGLSYGPIERADGVLRLRYRYWTTSAAALTGQVDLDPVTLLPIRSEQTQVFGGTSIPDTVRDSWTWQPVALLPRPRVCAS